MHILIKSQMSQAHWIFVVKILQIHLQKLYTFCIQKCILNRKSCAQIKDCLDYNYNKTWHLIYFFLIT